MTLFLRSFFTLTEISSAAPPFLLEIVRSSNFHSLTQIDILILERNSKFVKMPFLNAISSRKRAKQVIYSNGPVILKRFTAFIDGAIHAYKQLPLVDLF